MGLRIHVNVWGQLLFTALGFAPLASCGGAIVSDPGGPAPDGGPGDRGSGGARDTAGAGGSDEPIATAGFAGTGGFADTGGFAGTGGIPEDTGPGGATNPFPCVAPSPVVDPSSGFEKCEGGFVHRQRRATCPSPLPRPIVYGELDGGVYQCTKDSDCAQGKHGYCYEFHNGTWSSGAYCLSGCVSDDECGAGWICQCGDPVGKCVVANCRSDADCGSNMLCTSYESKESCGGYVFACQGPDDTCATDSQCQPFSRCTIVGTRHTCVPWGCNGGETGRPFLVHGRPRTAPRQKRPDWRQRGVELSIRQRMTRGREVLAQAWTKAALAEHASIAAFARFTLQLLSLGAPPELIEQSNSALADETKHAKLCFAIASAFGDVEEGPGPLAIHGSLDDCSLRSILVTTIREGCIGETIAALEAAEACERASEPFIREALATIARDETRHAELAWRFVRWALARGGADLRHAVRAEFEAAAAVEPRDATEQVDETERALLEGGILTESLRARVRAEAVAGVVLPCARALLHEADSPMVRSTMAIEP